MAQYEVTKTFTDKNGKQWHKGEVYTATDPADTQAQVSAGNIAEKKA